MSLPDWATTPQTILAFAAGIGLTIFVLFLSPGWRDRVREFLGLTPAKGSPRLDPAAAPARVRRYALGLELPTGHAPPRLFVRTLQPNPGRGGGWETYRDEEVAPQGPMAQAPLGGGAAPAGDRRVLSFELRTPDILRWLLNQDESLPFKPFLLVPEAAVAHYRNELCRNGHTVTGWGDDQNLPAGQWRVWFLFANGRPHGADEVQDLNHVA